LQNWRSLTSRTGRCSVWNSKWTKVIVVVLIVVVWPFYSIMQQHSAAAGYLGKVTDRPLRYVIVDRSHWDRYRCLIYDGEYSGDVHTMSDEIYVDGRAVEFPEDENLAMLAANGSLVFDTVGPDDVVGTNGYSATYWVFGRFPDFKKYPKSARPTDEYLRAHATEFFTENVR
jgi:hypothetical protein